MALDPTSVSVPAAEHRPPSGDSRAQRAAERYMLDALGIALDIALEPTRIVVGEGVRVEVDGATADQSVLVECWAHQGAPKSAQRNKVLTDALKLSWLAMSRTPRPRLILCLSDDLAALPFRSPRKWAARALADLDVEVMVVDIPSDIRADVAKAQVEQYR